MGRLTHQKKQKQNVSKKKTTKKERKAGDG
jgi:hypothetical protein